MMKGLGSDVVSLDRVHKFILRHRDSAVRRILSPAEGETFRGYTEQRAIEFFAGRFAAKEAVAKAIGCGLANIHPNQVNISLTSNGLQARFLGAFPRGVAQEDKLWITISHTHEIAFAVAVWESRTR